MTTPVSVIGMGLSPRDLTEAHLQIIRQADVLVGGKRHLDFFKDSPARKIDITGDLKAVVEAVKKQMRDSAIVVLASGDPLFYGIGSVLIRSLEPDNVLIYPNISSVSAAFARIKMPWHDAHTVSLHGRHRKEALLSALVKKDKIVVFTDPENSPARLAGFLLDRGITGFDMCVLEQMGTDSERVGWYPFETAAGMRFSEPNLVVLKRRETRPETTDEIHPGMPEHRFEHREGLITKAEVRAVTLSKLRLMPDHVMWDLGAGSGSVSIEASVFVRRGKIFAVEKNPERIKQIENNRKRFDVKHLEIIRAELPEGLDKLPVPDRVFIGGGGKDLEKIIRSASRRIQPDGIMVINTILIPNIDTALAVLKSEDFETSVVQVQISRGREMPWGERLEAENPVWIVSGVKRKPV